jgi:hypothetical protein
MSKSMREWLISCGIILLTLLVFFGDALFTGKNFLSEGDNVAFYSFIPFLDQAKHTGEFPLWVPYIFGGMPSLASFLAAGDRSWDVVSAAVMFIPRLFGESSGNDTWRLVLWYAIYGWGVYTLMRSKNHTQGVAIFTAIAAVFSTWVMVWIMIGHSTKPVSFATLPWILFALERLREKFSLQSLFVLTLAMTALVSATHPQMMFYLGCAAALYLLTELVVRLVNREGPMDVLKGAAGLVLATGLALGTHADMFLSTRAYTPYSTRGSAPLVQVQGAQQQQDGGNDYEYATNWSFSPEEMATFFVPNYYGFGNTEVKMPGSAKPQRTNLYWGQMPFTDAANYMGIGVLLLAVIAAWSYRRDPFVIFLVVLALFSLLLSFGKNASVLYDVFYNYFPAFNKFRAPSMALCLMQFAMPVLAGYGLAAVLGWAGDSKKRRTGLIALAAGAGFLLLGLAYTSAFEEGYKDELATQIAAKQSDRIKDASQVPTQYLDVVYKEMRGDWVNTGILAVGFGLLVWLVIRGSIKPNMAIYLAIGLTVIDLWRVAKRPYEPQEGSPEKNVFRRTDIVDYLKQDKDVYRIADLSGLPANWWAYHLIENVHGYSSAKFRIYQDMLDVAGRGPGSEPQPGNSIIVNPLVWDLLNVKYVVSRQPAFTGEPLLRSSTGALLYQNPGALPRAWFVDTVTVQEDRRTTLNHLRDADFEPRNVAFVEKSVGVESGNGAATATARVTNKGNQHLAFDVNTDAKRLLVVSEVYYPEWHCFIDGQETPIHRTDFLLRGVVVPPGKHNVRFAFRSEAFENGRNISMAANAGIILIGLGSLFLWWQKRSKGATAT